jgi:hypothetical protein
MARRSLVLVATLFAALLLASAAAAARVTIRVEGKTQTIFGSQPVAIDAANALQALDIASTLGEFYYGVTHSSFGDYVSQVGKYPGVGSAGWVFKVNGVSPPVGADQVQLNDGDSVLWYYATFGSSGGPPTLDLKPLSGNCYGVTSYDDAGKPSPAAGAVIHVDGRRVKVVDGKGCVGRHKGLVRAYSFGTVRSNSAK